MAKRKALSVKEAAKARKLVADQAADSLAMVRQVGLVDVNSAYYDAVLQAMHVLAAGADFNDLTVLPTLEIENNDKCGVISAYDHDEFLSAIKRGGVYVAGCTVGAFDLFANPTPGVPLSERAIAGEKQRHSGV